VREERIRFASENVKRHLQREELLSVVDYDNPY